MAVGWQRERSAETFIDTAMSETSDTIFNRRSFVKSAAGAAAAAGSLATALQGQGIPKEQKLKVGFVGCGGRGTGAASNALSADDNIELFAMGDVFQDRIDKSLGILNEKFQAQGKVNVPKERQFVGLEAYKAVIDSGVDVVILTSTPGFRPLHLRAAVEAGKHIFAEKPMAVDMAGVREVMEVAKLAKSKPISIVAGFCWRYSPSRVAAFRKVLEEGAIGDVLSIYATYYSGQSKPHLAPGERAPGMSDIEWQIRNWYNYTWLGGGGLVEQAVHSVDKIAWAMRDQAPLACRATGGLHSPQEGGNIFDHYHVAYEFPNQVWCHLGSRKAPGCFNENADYIRGSLGTLVIGRGANPYIEDKQGEKIWSYRAPREGEANMYQVEHDQLFASIRSGKFINDGDRMIHSTAMAIMGRMAAYTGKELSWEEALQAQEDLFPNEAGMQWSQSFDPGPVSVPGVSKIEGVS